MKKLLLILLASVALLAPAIAGQNEKFTGNTQIQSGSFTIQPGVAVSGVVRKFSLGTPIAATPANVVGVTAIKANAATYTVALATLDVARNLSVTRALTSTVDTGSTSLVIVGTDTKGLALTETIAIPATATIGYGTKAFKTISSVTQSGTNTAVDGADTVSVGVGPLLGLPFSLDSATTEILTTVGTTVGNYATTRGTLATSTVNASAATYDGSKKVTVYLEK